MANSNPETARAYLNEWRETVGKNIVSPEDNFSHSIHYYFPKQATMLQKELLEFGKRIVQELEPLVDENNQDNHLPQLEQYNSIGERIDNIIHHPSYATAGDIIYSSKLLARMTKPGGLLECLVFFFLSSHAGEAGHNCPIACSAGILRTLNMIPNFPRKNDYLQKLIQPSYSDNFTGAQFLTEIQGGSDVGQNATIAHQDKENNWLISGEKWFCSNADAELFLITARFDQTITGTKGLALYLVPARLENGEKNNFSIRRLKQKIGTRSLATAEIDFLDAKAYLVGDLKNSFNILMENVLHISRLFNSFTVLGMTRRALEIATAYAQRRLAFDKPIIQYPLVQEHLATIKAENLAMLASICATTTMQDDFDLGHLSGQKNKLLLRLLVNLNKYFSAKQSVDHIHHCLDILAGNGTIEDFSTIPRLLRDAIVCENWEGTHYTLWMQILRDIKKYNVADIFLNFINDQLSAIQGYREQCELLTKASLELREQCETLKNLDEPAQTLLIKTIVKQMVVIYCSLSLLKEGIHQKEQWNNPAKLNCLDYFNRLHFEDEASNYDKKYQTLIAKINKM